MKVLKIILLTIILLSTIVFFKNYFKMAFVNDISECGPTLLGKTSNYVGDLIDTTINFESKFSKTLTLDQHLLSEGVVCANNILYKDKTKVVIYNEIGCWGMPPEDYSDILSAQDKNIQELKTQFYVVEVPCNPEGLLLQ